jgi:hypothetical protein
MVQMNVDHSHRVASTIFRPRAGAASVKPLGQPQPRSQKSEVRSRSLKETLHKAKGEA